LILVGLPKIALLFVSWFGYCWK